jgi:hypothetical protein
VDVGGGLSGPHDANAKMTKGQNEPRRNRRPACCRILRPSFEGASLLDVLDFRDSKSCLEISAGSPPLRLRPP